MTTDLPTKRILCVIIVTQTLLRVLPTRWRQKSTGINMEQTYVTVTLGTIQRFPLQQSCFLKLNYVET